MTIELIACFALHRVSVIDFATGIAPKQKSEQMNAVWRECIGGLKCVNRRHLEMRSQRCSPSSPS